MKTILSLILAVGWCVMLARADEIKPPVKAEITAELRAKFWRASAENTAAQMQAQKTTAAVQVIVDNMQKVCGDAQLTIGQDGEPACVAKPPETKPK
jgi:hypothetical protein